MTPSGDANQLSTHLHTAILLLALLICYGATQQKLLTYPQLSPLSPNSILKRDLRKRCVWG